MWLFEVPPEDWSPVYVVVHSIGMLSWITLTHMVLLDFFKEKNHQLFLQAKAVGLVAGGLRWDAKTLTLCQCVAWWHQMETFSALLALCVWNLPVPVNSPNKGQWRGALMFSFISAWIHGWVSNREAGDLRHRRAHYDAIAMPMNFVFSRPGNADLYAYARFYGSPQRLHQRRESAVTVWCLSAGR